jgi:hypothetical protein
LKITESSQNKKLFDFSALEKLFTNTVKDFNEIESPSSGSAHNDRVGPRARKFCRVIVGRPAAELLDVCQVNLLPLSRDESFNPGVDFFLGRGYLNQTRINLKLESFNYNL